MGKKKKSKASNSSDPSPKIDFEKSLAEAEEVVQKLESGELGLAESLDKYEMGVKRIKQCHQALQAAQRRVSLLSGVEEDGTAITETFTDIEGDETVNGSDDDDASWEEADDTDDWDDENVDDVPGLF